jgi:hypothetical protein
VGFVALALSLLHTHRYGVPQVLARETGHFGYSTRRWPCGLPLGFMSGAATANFTRNPQRVIMQLQLPTDRRT